MGVKWNILHDRFIIKYLLRCHLENYRGSYNSDRVWIKFAQLFREKFRLSRDPHTIEEHVKMLMNNLTQLHELVDFVLCPWELIENARRIYHRYKIVKQRRDVTPDRQSIRSFALENDEIVLVNNKQAAINNAGLAQERNDPPPPCEYI